MNAKQTVMILGGGHFMVPAIKTAKEMGLSVLVTDRNKSAEGFKYSDLYEVADISDVDKSLMVAKRHKVDGILPLNDYGVKTAAVIAEEMGLPGITPESAEICTDKRRMREQWERAGLPSPKFKEVRDETEARRAAEEIGFPVITKPPDTMGGSRGVVKINDISELENYFSYAKKFSHQSSILLEEYVTGYECSIESVSYKDNITVIGISDKTKLPPPFRVDKSVTYPTKHPEPIQSEIIKVTKKAISSLNVGTGATHVELSVTEEGIRLFEIGARTGGGGIIASIQMPIVYGVNMMKEVINTVLGNTPEFTFKERYAGSDFRFITPRPGIVKSIQNLDRALSPPQVVTGACFVKPFDTINPIQSGSDRVGYVVTAGESRDEAVSVADRFEKTVKFEYMSTYNIH